MNTVTQSAAAATRDLMGMPVTIQVADGTADDLAAGFALFAAADARFSTYRADSEISRLNRGELTRPEYSLELQEILVLAAQTREETLGYFDIRRPDGRLDPSGLVKGWAIHRVAELLRQRGRTDFYVDAGGDLEVAGRNPAGQPWRIGLRHPRQTDQFTKVITLPDGGGVATSGTYRRGEHLYNPHTGRAARRMVQSVTVIGPNAYEADRFATAVFVKGPSGLDLLAEQPDLEGYLITADDRALSTPGFDHYARPPK